MKTTNLVVLPSTLIAAAVMLSGCVGSEPIEGDEDLDVQSDAQIEPESVQPEESPTAVNSACWPNTMTFDLPGKPDVKVTVQTCVESDGDYYRPYVLTNWTGTMPYIGGTRFNSFVISYRLERYDTSITIFPCDLTSAINNNNSGSQRCAPVTSYHSTLSGGWSADGVVVYDIANDGKGSGRWELHGSPLIP